MIFHYPWQGCGNSISPPHIETMDDTEIGKSESDTAKLRRCLKCQTPFHSAWEGHRVCDRCKHTSGWREGMPAYSSRFDGHR